MSIKTVSALILAVFLFACKGDEIYYYPANYSVSYSIASPKSGWTYYDDNKVLLSLNINTHEIKWHSSIDGYLGEGNHLLAYLSPGGHTISSSVSGTKKTVQINVLRRNIIPGGEIKTIVNYSPFEQICPAGKAYSYLMTLDGTITGFRMDSTARKSLLQGMAINGGLPDPVSRDMRIEVKRTPAILLMDGNKKEQMRQGFRLLGENKKMFYVPNTSSSYALPHELSAVLFHSSDKLQVWIPEFETIDKGLLSECIQEVEEVILSRLEQIWGKAADINQDGTLAILVSKTINDERVAIGFFNPADFYRRETDVNSNAYNPDSNEMDIIYIAAPDNTSSSYNKESIIATIAHEVTHAITYTQKTWEKELAGKTNVKREDLFLDEGLSHLSEVLCGIGFSGGTVKYMQRYFENTADYSFCGRDVYGRDDSVGMRGAITLFLSWLFWAKGGMEYSGADPSAVIDTGGIRFLKELVNSDGTGWENIGKIAGTTTDKLFEAMAAEINRLRIKDELYQYKTDALTGEPAAVFANMVYKGTFTGFPAQYNITKSVSTRPWSLVFFDPFVLENRGIITLLSTEQKGISYFILKNLP